MSTILEKILSVKRDEIAALSAGDRPGVVRELLSRCADLPPTRGFARAISPNVATAPSPLFPAGKRGLSDATTAPSPLFPAGKRGLSDATAAPSPLFPAGKRGLSDGVAQGEIALIAEVKKASPSKGVIRADFDPVAIASAYASGGARCLSVLTDREFFQGEPGYLAQIREAVPLPLLRKDFILDPIQVYEARALGADAVLLIVAAVPSPARLAELRHAAESVGMDALIEVHNAAELALAVESGASLIGVNNRDLHTFEVRLETAESLLPTFPEGTLAVAESGIFTPEDIARMRAAGAHAVLVGEALMRQSDIGAATKALLGH